MSRREISVTIGKDNRDKGKTFVLREMNAEPAEDWFLRAMQLLMRGGMDVPDDLFVRGAAGFVTLGLGAVMSGLGKAPHHEVKPLLDEMMACVVRFHAVPGGPGISDAAVISSQIEEVDTRLYLRMEVLSLHLGFSIAERLSEFRMIAAQWIAASGLTTETPPDQSASLSPAD